MTPYYWDGDAVILAAGFHRFAVGDVEVYDTGRARVIIYGWPHECRERPHILPPDQGWIEEVGHIIDPEQRGSIEIPCLNAEMARGVMEDLFKRMGCTIAREKP